MPKENLLIIISGATATGKTSTSIRIAKLIQEIPDHQCVIVNFDSLLFYKEISIGTAKPDTKEREGIEHHLIGISSITAPLNASQYALEAFALIQKLHQEKKVVILVGGSAFYLRALIKGMYEAPVIPDEIKEESNILYKSEGISIFRTFLKEHDYNSYISIHENDHYRTLRAYEYTLFTKKKFSELKEKSEKNDPYDFSHDIRYPWNIHHIYLDIPKEEHFNIIIKRTNSMIEQGLEQEVQLLLKSGFTGLEKPLQSIGYKEIIDFQKGLFSSLDECIERINISTRQLAKSQRTFFNKIIPKKTFHPLENALEIDQSCLDFLNS